MNNKEQNNLNLYILSVLLDRKVRSFSRTFDYAYYSDKELKKGVRVKVLFKTTNANKFSIGYVLSCEKIDMSLQEYCKIKEYNIKEIISVVDTDPVINENIFTLATMISEYYYTPLNKVLSTILIPQISLKKKSLSLSKGKLITKYLLNEELFNTNDISSLKRNELNLIKKIQETNNQGLLISDISAKKALNSCLDKNLIIKKEEYIDFDKLESSNYELSNLNTDQEKALNKIKNTTKDIFLLHGVTGSGKSEIFIHLAYENYKNNKSTIILVPEISLTEDIAKKLKSLFKDDCYIIHSELANSSKYIYFNEILNKEKVVIIGARSALFAPVNNLATIVIDESHTTYSYKNSTMPTYNALQVSIFLNLLTKCKIVLTSATPLVTDMARAEKGIYDYFELKDKYIDRSIRNYSIVDLSKGNEFCENQTIFAKTTLDEIDKVVTNHKQVLILLNRRAYETIIQCEKCNKIVKCPNCAQYLVYYKNSNIAKCNCCEYKIELDKLECSRCHSKSFDKYGYGTQKVIDTLAKLRPNYKILRLDSDLVNKNEKKEVINKFANHEADILVGTQLISKGHNFKEAELVVSLDTDYIFSIPTYEANEQCFDLLVQLFGRVGRFDTNGKCLIQTYQKDNPIFTFATDEDYHSFYKNEMEVRKVTLNPPYTYIIKITTKNTDLDTLIKDSLKIKNYLVAKIGTKTNIYGPNQPFHFKIKNNYILEILVKYKSKQFIDSTIKGIYDLPLDNSTDFNIDVDPTDS